MEDDNHPTPEDQPFDWSADIPAPLMLTIAQLGDHEMRLLIASNPKITDEAGAELISLGDKELSVAIRKNINTSPKLFELAAKPRRAARAAKSLRRKKKKEELQLRTSFVNAVVTR